MNDGYPQDRINHIVTETDYIRFRDLVMARTGLIFGPRRRETFASTILAAASQASRTSLDEYFIQLQTSQTDGDKWIDLIPRLTICETYFFRDPGLIAALREHILPELIARHEADRCLRLWSAGCATGEEPYTLAILLCQLLPDIERWHISILATDINRQALAQAIVGHYRPWSFRQTDTTILEQYFIQRDNCFEINPRLHAMVTYGYLNMAEPAYPAATNQTHKLDLILWRNVSLYLPENVTREVADRLYDCLSPGGWLVVGPSETNPDVYRKFQLARFDDAFVYRKALDPGSSHEMTSPGISGYKMVLEAGSENGLYQQKRDPEGESWGTSADPLAYRLPKKPEIQDKDVSFQKRQGEAMLDPYQEGLSRMQKGLYAEALQYFLSYLDGNPGDAVAYHQVARLYANGGRLSEAQLWAERALEQDPLLEEAHYTLALIYHEQGKLEAAIPCLKKALYLKPDFVMAYVNLADIYHQLGRVSDAIRHRNQAIRLASGHESDAVLPGSDGLKAGDLLAQV